MNEEKINQILINQSVIMVTLASLYSDEKEDIEVLNQLFKRQGEIKSLLCPKTKPTLAKKTKDALSDELPVTICPLSKEFVKSEKIAGERL